MIIRFICSFTLLVCPLLVIAQEHTPTFIELSDSSISEYSQTNIKSILKNKRIIGLGEATHGTHEFFTMKRTLVQFLVQEMNFKIFCIESNFSAFTINDYINGKHNDWQKVMSETHQVYHTQEVVQLIKWIRKYNSSVPNEQRIIFYGIDNRHIGSLVPQFTNYIQSVDPTYLQECVLRLDELQGKLVKIKRSHYLKNLTLIAQRLITNKKLYTEANTGKAWDLAYKMIKSMQNAVENSTMINDHGNKSQTFRDKSMAENIKWILEHEGKENKLVIWAHNGHIQKTEYNLKRKDHYRMGMALNDFFKEQYYSIGFDFDKGSFNAVNYLNGAKMKACHVNNEKNNSFAQQFRGIDMPCFFVDFKSLIGTPYEENLNNSVYIRQSGVGFSGEEFTFPNLNIKSAFDAMIFFKRTTPSIFVDARRLIDK